jgi:hypothetical protein
VSLDQTSRNRLRKAGFNIGETGVAKITGQMKVTVWDDDSAFYVSIVLPSGEKLSCATQGMVWGIDDNDDEGGEHA